MAATASTSLNGTAGLGSGKPAAEERLDLSTTTFKRLHPRTYLERFLSSHIREDGRSFSSWRPTSIVSGAISSADGSCLVRLGVTTVVAGIKAEIAKPDAARGPQGSERGWLVPNIEYGPLSSARGRPGPPTEEAQIVCDRLTEILTSTARPILDATSLCIEKDIAAWCLYLDITVISNDGNILDAAVLAAVGALQNCRLPKTFSDEVSGQILCSSDRSLRKPLQLLSLPLSFAFGVYEGAYLLSDTSSFEGAFTSSSNVVVGLSEWTEEGRAWRRRSKGKQAESTESQMDVDDALDEEDLAISFLHQVGRCRAILPPDEQDASSSRRPILTAAEVISSCLAKARRRHKEMKGKLEEASKDADRRGAVDAADANR